MKVNVDQTVEVSDEDRKLIAAQFGQKQVTRDDLKAFLWRYGAGWADVIHPVDDELAEATDELTQAIVDLDDVTPDEDEDLI